jgi:peptidoglycan/xylan/chitin deacetylase (PgdA/CDA1 family)
MTRRRWIAAGLALLVAIGGLFQLSRERCFSLILPSICRVETRDKVVALSFDDGPTDLGIATTLPLLKAAGARATFFVVGEQAAARPDLLRLLLASGMELGNHSWSHRRMVAITPAFAAAEIDRTAAAIRAAGGNDHRLFRAPYGKKLLVLPYTLKHRGYRLVMADLVDPVGTATPQAFADAMLAQVKPGSILLIHPMFTANEQGRQALPLVLTGLKARGFEIVTVGELLARGRVQS